MTTLFLTLLINANFKFTTCSARKKIKINVANMARETPKLYM